MHPCLLNIQVSPVLSWCTVFFQFLPVDSFLICQDPLERFFGVQYRRGGVHENPNVVEFTTINQALRVVNSFCHAPSRGNCRGGVSEQDVLLRPLPKRSRFSSKTADGNQKNRIDVALQTPPGNLNQF